MISYTKNSASLGDIYKHLVTCDVNFEPLLSSRVNLTDYSCKIRNNAVTFEAWNNNNLIGLVACFANDKDDRKAFITIVSVVLGFQKKGIAKQLLINLFSDSSICAKKEVRLEVHMDNIAAISLYSQFGFRVEKQEGFFITMLLVIPSLGIYKRS